MSTDSTTPTKTTSSTNTTDEHNPPLWPKSVIVIKKGSNADTIKDLTDHTTDNVLPPGTKVWNDPNSTETIYGNANHFIENRYAILFEPGTYTGVDLEVGYYSQVLGLGETPDQVKFEECDYGPYCPALLKNEDKNGYAGLALDTFWRCAENYQTYARKGQLWAVSQAAPLRRVHVAKNPDSSVSDNSGTLLLHDNGAMASGGHAANIVVDTSMKLGSQQQFCLRSVSFADKVPKEDLGAWSFMFVDCLNPPDERDGITSEPYGEWKANPSVSVENPEITVEKPFIVLTSNETTEGTAETKYELHVPAPRKRDDSQPLGATFGTTGTTKEEVDIRPFERVKVAVSEIEDSSDMNIAKKINAALREGKDIVLTPGMYYLDEPLEITQSNQVLLGIGMATLIAPVDGSPCIKVAANLEGVRIAGIMLEASFLKKTNPGMTSCFIQWGDNGNSDQDLGNSSNPGALTDIFARVGGSNLNRAVSTNVMVRIDSGNVYGDNLWLWRADHVKLIPAVPDDPNSGESPNFSKLGLDYHQTTLGECPCETGLEVNGDDVTIHGLAVEHTTEHNTIWNGERGKVMFYQNELPYDVNSDFGSNGFVGYKVDDNVTTHVAKAVGVYSNFRDYEVSIATAMTHPGGDSISFQNPFAVWLDSRGQIKSVINGCGESLQKKSDVGRYKEFA